MIFRDLDKSNVSIDNLMLITKRQHLQLNSNGWRFDDPELQKLGITLADMKIKMGDLERKAKNDI